MAEATWSVYVDWENTGTYAGSYDDISAYVQEAQWSYGRDYASQLTGRSIAGSCSLLLKNSDGRFNSFNSSSPIYGKILPGRRMMIRATVGASVTGQWYGFLDAIEPRPTRGGYHTALLRGIGPLGYIRSRRVSVEMKTSITTGDAITEILDQIGWPAADRDIDTGQTTMTRWWTGGQLNALEAMREIENTEAGFVRETKDGKIAFEDRNHRYLGTHVTSQTTYSDVAGASIVYSEVVQIDPLREIYNIIESVIKTYTVGDLAVLWTLSETGSNSPQIDPGNSVTLWATYPNLGSAATGVGVAVWTTPVATTDFTANTQSNGGGTDKTADISVAVEKFDQSMKITLTNGSASVVYLTFLQARGTPVLESDPITVKREDTTSQEKYGERTYPLTNKFTPTSSEAEMYCGYILSIYKDPHPVLTLKYPASRSDGQLAEALARDVSDRVTIVGNGAADLGINEDFFVENVTWKVKPGSDYQVSLQCSNATAYSGAWVLGLSELGTTTKLSF